MVSLNNMTTIRLNTNFVLCCVASSPSPTMVPSWTFPTAANATGGVTIMTVTQEGVVNSTLNVTSVGSGGGGVYTCAFTSRLLEDGINSSTTVVVLGKSPPSHHHIISCPHHITSSLHAFAPSLHRYQPSYILPRSPTDNRFSWRQCYHGNS